MKSHDCNEFRQAWLESRVPGALSSEDSEVERASSHVSPAASPEPQDTCATCATCAAWSERQARLVDQLAELERMQATEGLEMRLILDFEHPEAPAVRGITALSRADVPEQLAERLHSELHERRDEPQVAQALRSARPHLAPRVLDRLVREELEKPELARAARFAGDLGRRKAPRTLEGRLHDGLGEEPRPRVLRLVAPLAAAAAVVFVLALTRPWSSSQAAEPSPYSFDVVRLDSSAELNASQRAWIGGIGGGVLGAVEPADLDRVPLSRRALARKANRPSLDGEGEQ